MSDFFAALAARARNAQTVVRPRLPALFEPAPIGANGGFDAPSDLEIISAASEAPPPAPVARRTEPAPLARDAEAPPVAAAVPQTSTHHAASQARASLPPAAAEPPALSTATPRVERASEAARPPARAQASNDTPRKSPAAGEPPAAQVRSPVPPAASAPKPSSRSDSALLSSHERPPSPMPPAAPAMTARPVAPRAVAPADAPRAATARSETIIHVSIGRVEVRATPAAPERRRQEGRSPVMSLTDYLRTRSGRNPP